MIEINHFFKDICSSSLNSWIGTILHSTLYTSLLLAIVMLIIICFIYPSKQAMGLNIVFRLIFYIFMSSFIIIMIHDKLIECGQEEKYANKMDKEVLRNIKGGDPILDGERKAKVIPKYTGGDDIDNIYENDNKELNIDDPDAVLKHVLGNSNNIYINNKPPINGGADIKVHSSSVNDMLNTLGV